MKKKAFLFSSLMAGIIALASIVLTSINPDPVYRANAETKSYGITFDSTKNKLHNYDDDKAHYGEAIAKTDLGSDIKFYYQGLKTTENSWHSLMSGGKLSNIDPIHGMQSITIVSKTDGANCTIQYLHDAYDTDECKYYNFVSKKDEKMTFDFNGYYPNHFMLRYYGDEGTYFDITSISISFYCADNPLNYPFLNVFTDDESLGTVHGRGLQKPGSNITISASPNRGASFIGWYDRNDKLISTEVDYSFVMPSVDVMYKAKFKKDSYTISVTTNDETMGTVAGSGVFEHGDDVRIIATAKEPYAFQGWYFDFDKDFSFAFSTEPIYSFKADQSCNLIARFVKKYKLDILSEDENKGTVIAPTECYEGFTVEIKAIAKKGYAFDHWHDNELNEVSNNPNYTFTMPANDVSLYASFAIGGYTFSVSSEDELKGTVNDVSNRYREGTLITVVAKPAEDCDFKGWYHESTKVSDEASYTFTMPSDDYSLVAHFITKAEAEEIAKYAKEPIVSSDGKTITYGLYPQKNVSDSFLISALNSLTTPESNGWYLYNKDYYAKVSAMPYESSYKFDNGVTVSNGATYWFKCEPIVWNVLSSNGGEYYIVSSILLDAHRYNEYYSGTKDGHYANNYKYSEIRAWLNDDFYNSAFALGNSQIQITAVDNSASTTGDTSNPYVCANTEDKVFLPSYKDLTNISFGFSTLSDDTDTRYCKTTDWARARGASCPRSSSGLYNGFYWTRSPNSGFSSVVWRVDGHGRLNSGLVNCADYSVRPALSIKIA